MNVLSIVRPESHAGSACSGTGTKYCPIVGLQKRTGEAVSGQYLLSGAADVTSATPRLQLTLSDATGSVLGFVWPENRHQVRLPPIGLPVNLEATVRSHEGRPQLCITRLDALEPDDVELAADIICAPGQDPIHQLLRELELSLPQPLRRFLARVLMDPGIGSTFLACRASGRHHHPGKGGLIAHSLENLDLIATTVRRTLPGDPVSVAIAQLGYLLHDVGKIRTVGASKRPELHHVVRHETHNLLLLAPHLDWLRMQAADIYAGLSYVMEYVATPAAARSRARYFPAEVVVQFDQWSAAAHSCRDLKALCGAPASGATRAGLSMLKLPSVDSAT